MKKKPSKIQKTVTVGMLGAIAYVLMLLNFPFPGFPKFLMIDFSDIPALLATIIFGPIAGILVELLKNILDYMMTGSETGIPVGHIANFIGGIAFILPVYYIYKKSQTKKGMVIGLIGGTITLAVLMSIINYYVLLPVYTALMGWPVMSGSEIFTYITTAIVPFNILKGVLLTIIFMLLFSKLQGWINKQSIIGNAS